MEEAEVDTGQPDQTKLPPNGSGAQATTRGAADATSSGSTAKAGASVHTAPTRLSFGSPPPPIIPINRGAGTTPDNPNNVEHLNRFAPLRQ